MGLFWGELFGGEPQNHSPKNRHLPFNVLVILHRKMKKLFLKIKTIHAYCIEERFHPR
jgi:hypothetical protein